MKQTNYFLKITLTAILAVLLTLIAFVPLSRTVAFAWDGTVDSAYQSGTGTEQDPYLITNEQQLAFFATQVNVGSSYSGQFFRLENDLNLSGTNWTPIGKFTLNEESAPVEMIPFSGSFDGNGCTITGLALNGEHGQGLFGYIGKEGSVANLTLKSVDIKAQDMAGGVAGVNFGHVKNITVENIVITSNLPESGAFNIGGLVGNNTGTVEKCTVQGLDTKIVGATAVGGVVGNNQKVEETDSALVTECEFKDGQIQTDTTAGGIVGENLSRVEKSKIGSDIMVTAVGFGGIVGTNDVTATIDLCAMNFKVTLITSPPIVNIETGVQVSVYSEFGGIVARNQGVLSNCYFRGTMEGVASYVGGIAAENSGEITLSYALTESMISSDDYGTGGGIAGLNNGKIDQSTAVFHTLSSEGLNASLGGITGINNGTISNVFAKGRLTATNGVAGGIAGLGMDGTVSNALTVTNVSGKAIDGIFVSTQDAVRQMNEGIIDSANDLTGQVTDRNVAVLGSVEKSFYAEFAYHDLTGTSKGSALSIDELLALDSTSLGDLWQYDRVNLPVLNGLSSFAGDSIVGISDTVISDARNWRSATTTTLMLDGVEHSALNGADYCLPIPQAKEGFAFSVWETGQTQFSAGDFVPADGKVYVSVWVLNNIVEGTQSANIDKVYDGTQSTLTVDFRHALSLTYVWYYSIDNTVFAPLQGGLGEYAVTNVAQSGYYYCEATVSSDGQTKTEQSAVFTVTISKAEYSGISHAQVDGTVYAPDKTLADIVLFLGYTWADNSIVPTAGTKSYSAIYNADPDNYNDFQLMVDVVVSKAVYVDITHDGYTGSYDPRKPLSNYVLKAHFRWANPNILPNVQTTQYAAIYNADAVNYVDFALNIEVKLAKADYANISHAGFIGIYSASTTLANYKLDTGFSWVNAAVIPTVDVKEYQAIYHLDADNYNAYSLTIRVAVDKAVPIVTPVFDTESSVYEGDSVPAISLGANNTNGLISWADTVLTLGTKKYTWSFVPTDTVNYKTATGEETFTALAVRLTGVRKEVGEGAKVEYTAFDLFDATGITLIATYNSGKEASIQFSLIKYGNGDSFRAGDQTVSLICKDGETEFSVSVNVTVAKKTVIQPSCEVNFVYSGEEITLPILPHDDYTVEGNVQLEVGKYNATITLNDPHNYRWADGDSSPFVIEWNIDKRVISKPSLTKTYTYNGEEQRAEITPTADFDVVNYIQKNAGEYDLRVTLRDAAHTKWADGTGAEFILIWKIGVLYIGNPQAVQKTYVYNGQTQVFAYVPSKYMVVAGDRQTEAKRHTVTFRLADTKNTEWSAPGMAERILYWDIAPFAVTKPIDDGSAIVYNGQSQTFSISPNEFYTVEGNKATKAGNYTTIVTLNGSNYCWEGGEITQLSYPWEIKKLEISLPTDGETVTYNGLDIVSTVVIDELYAEFVSGGSGKNAGIYATVVRLTDSNNVCWTGGDVTDKTVNWEIAKRAVEVPSPATVAYVYNGRPISLFSSNLSFVTVKGGVFTETGQYNAQLNLTDKSNYAWTDGTDVEVQIAWEISAMKIALPSASGTRQYMGREQTAPIAESSYYTLTGNKGTNANRYTATAALVDKRNTTWTSGSVTNVSIPWTIEKAKVNLPILQTNGIYSGREQSANIELASVCSVTGNRGTEAGEYTAKIRLNDSSNYIWADGTSEDKSVKWHIYSLQLNIGGEEDNVAYEPGTPLPTPTKEGYVFGGWYLNENFEGAKVDKLTSLDGNAVLYAKWEKESSLAPVEPPKKSGGLSLYAIIGISVGGVCALAAVAIIVYASATKSRRRRQD